MVTVLCLILLQPTLYFIKEFLQGETTVDDICVDVLFTSDDIIRLSVSGKVFTTTKTTLLLREKASLLERIASGSSNTLLQDNGAYFIDRDPELFSYVLEYLRTGKITRRLNLELRDALMIEADYFALPGLKDVIKTPLYESRASVTKWIDLNKKVLLETFSRLVVESGYSAHIAFKTNNQYEVEYIRSLKASSISSQKKILFQRRENIKETFSVQTMGTNEFLIGYPSSRVFVEEMKKRFPGVRIESESNDREPFRFRIVLIPQDLYSL